MKKKPSVVEQREISTRHALSLIAHRVEIAFGLDVHTSITAPWEIQREARNTAAFIGRRLTGASYEKLGVFFGFGMHPSALRVCREVDRRYRTDAQFRRLVDELEKSLPTVAKEGPNA